jgi:hypothetical protein
MGVRKLKITTNLNQKRTFLDKQIQSNQILLPVHISVM